MALPLATLQAMTTTDAADRVSLLRVRVDDGVDPERVRAEIVRAIPRVTAISTAGAIALAHFRLLVPGWRGALIAWLAVVWIANVYMSLFVRLRLDIKRERVEISKEEEEATAPR